MSQLEQAAPIIRAPDEVPRYLWAGSTTMDVVLGAADTGGQFALIDQVGYAGDATPLHRHLHEDEAFYLIEGEIVAWAGEEEHHVAEGSALFLPRGLQHAFAIRSPRARLIIVTAPTGFEAFVAGAGIRHEGRTPTSWEFDLGRFMAPAQSACIEILGPPPSPS